MTGKRSFSRDRRAITPVLSNLLLTVVAVAAMAFATTATYVITSNLRENMSERILAEDVWFDNSTGNINVYLRNTGKVVVHVSAVYINRTYKPSSAPLDLDIGAHGWLGIPCSWVSDGLYHVSIITSRGIRIEGYYKAP